MFVVTSTQLSSLYPKTRGCWVNCLAISKGRLHSNKSGVQILNTYAKSLLHYTIFKRKRDASCVPIEFLQVVISPLLRKKNMDNHIPWIPPHMSICQENVGAAKSLVNSGDTLSSIYLCVQIHANEE